MLTANTLKNIEITKAREILNEEAKSKDSAEIVANQEHPNRKRNRKLREKIFSKSGDN